MGTKSSKPAPPPPPIACNVIKVPVPNGQRDYAWVDSTGRNGGAYSTGPPAGYVMCLKVCQPNDYPEIGPDKKPTGKMIYVRDVIRTNGLKNSKAGESYTPVVYQACSSPPCGNLNPMPPSTGCIP